MISIETNTNATMTPLQRCGGTMVASKRIKVFGVYMQHSKFYYILFCIAKILIFGHTSRITYTYFAVRLAQYYTHDCT